MSERNRAFAKFATRPFGAVHHYSADPEHLTECQVCRDVYGAYPDHPYRLTSRWRLLPHFSQAYEEAQQIVWALEHSDKYGWSRRTNGRGVVYKGAPRFLDRFKDKKHALSSVTKVVLMDKYGEWPSTLTRDEVRL